MAAKMPYAGVSGSRAEKSTPQDAPGTTTAIPGDRQHGLIFAASVLSNNMSSTDGATAATPCAVYKMLPRATARPARPWRDRGALRRSRKGAA